MKNGFLAFIILFMASTILSGCRNDVSDNRENETMAQPIILALEWRLWQEKAITY
jgi:hypothetical protein